MVFVYIPERFENVWFLLIFVKNLNSFKTNKQIKMHISIWNLFSVFSIICHLYYYRKHFYQFTWPINTLIMTQPLWKSISQYSLFSWDLHIFIIKSGCLNCSTIKTSGRGCAISPNPINSMLKCYSNPFYFVLAFSFSFCFCSITIFSKPKWIP